MNANSIYRDAIIDDGRQLLYEVTSRLYKGGNLRPDVYFQRDPKLGSKNYNKIFGIFDKTITESGPEENYDIREGARHFDVSVHTPIITHTCGLTNASSSSDDLLLRKVIQVRNLRNAVCHSGDTSNIVTEENLNEKLRELLELYQGIIKDLEAETGDNLSDVRMQVASKIMDRIKKHEARNNLSLQPYSTPLNPQHTVTPARRSTPDSTPAMPTWGKVALGVTTGIAALAVGVAVAGATSRESETEKRRRDKAKRNQTRNRNNNNNEECTVM